MMKEVNCEQLKIDPFPTSRLKFPLLTLHIILLASSDNASFHQIHLKNLLFFVWFIRGRQSLIAYGCQNFVVVFDPKSVQVRIISLSSNRFISDLWLEN